AIHIWSKNLEVVVGTLVVVEEEPLDSDEAVKLDPLRKVSRLVPVDGADRQVRLSSCCDVNPLMARAHFLRLLQSPELVLVSSKEDQALDIDHVANRNVLLLEPLSNAARELEMAFV